MTKVALVTGGTQGIGAAIARSLAAKGFAVVVTYREDKLAAVQFREQASQPEVFSLMKSDVCSDRDITDLIAFVGAKFGSLQVLVNNAGRVIAPSGWREITRETFLETLDTNLVGPSLLTRSALPLLQKCESASILNIGSTYGLIGDPWVIGYSAAKAGLIQLTRALAKELAPHINVNAILPGHIDTRMTRNASTEFLEEVKRQTPLRRLGTPEEVAELASLLVSDGGKFITGQTIVVDGGHVLR
jgi:3-oxoacyl-[acyl-carrier protein] reductase